MKELDFYKLVLKMRQAQDWNENNHQTAESLSKQWSLEFLVDKSLMEIGAHEKQIPKIPASFQLLSGIYCSN